MCCININSPQECKHYVLRACTNKEDDLEKKTWKCAYRYKIHTKSQALCEQFLSNNFLILTMKIFWIDQDK